MIFTGRYREGAAQRSAQAADGARGHREALPATDYPMRAASRPSP